ncbi:MAG: DUF3761 domain-containing protein, partial [Sphingomicrobium sp.]
MKILIPSLLIALAAIGVVAPASASTSPRVYDCSKSGNATKASCKAAAASVKVTRKATAAAAKASVKTASKDSPTKVKSTVVTKTTTERRYDCSKAGNKTKAQCKTTGMTKAKPIAKQVTTTAVARQYDCTKAGNTNKQVCKTKVTQRASVSRPTATARALPRLAATPVHRTMVQHAAATGNSENRNPAGAIAICKDGLYSHAAHRDGACARHHGVGKWIS